MEAEEKFFESITLIEISKKWNKCYVFEYFIRKKL